MFGTPAQNDSPSKYLPSKYVADKLLEQYWHAVHPIARILYQPSFEQRYIRLWQTLGRDSEPVASITAIVLAVLFLATISISDKESLRILAIPRQSLREQLQTGTKSALQRV